MAIPSFVVFIEPLLRALAQQPDGLVAASAYEAVAADLALTDADKAELLPSGQQAVYKNRCGWAQDRLKRAGLSESVGRGKWRLTPEGERYWAECGPTLSEEELRRVTDLKDQRQSLHWRERLASFRSDTAWVAKRQQLLEERRRVLPDMLALVRSFLSGEIGATDFKAAFDQRSRLPWSRSSTHRRRLRWQV